MQDLFRKAGEKICRQYDIRCTWSIPPMYGPYRKPPSSLERTRCIDACFEVWRPMWKAEAHAEHDLLKKNIQMVKNECTDFVDPLKKRLAKHRNNLYFWICVTPGELPFGSKNKPRGLGDFVELIDKFIKRDCFTSGIACIEQKRTCKDDVRPLHPHAHILVRRKLSCPPLTARKNTYSTFKKLYKKAPTPKTLYFMPCPIKFVQDKLTYISTGGKTGEGKASIQKEDTRWRLDHGFPTYWINGNIEPE